MSVTKRPRAKTIADLNGDIPQPKGTKLVDPLSLFDEADRKLINECTSLIKSYSGSWLAHVELPIMQEDLVRLSSLKISIIEQLGKYLYHAEHLSEIVRCERAKVSNQVRDLQKQLELDGEVVRLTVDDVKDLAYTKTADILRQSEEWRAAGTYIRWLCYAIKDICEKMDRALHRLWPLEMEMASKS